MHPQTYYDESLCSTQSQQLNGYYASPQNIIQSQNFATSASQIKNDNRYEFGSQSMNGKEYFSETLVDLNSASAFNVASLGVYPDDTKLVKVVVGVCLFGQTTQQLTALLDCGSTHSFISPHVLSQGHRAIVSEKQNMWGKQALYRVNGATGLATAWAFEAAATISLDEWTGDQAVVISPSVTKYDMILGMDWLRPKKVVLDMGKNKLRVESVDIDLNIIAMVQSIDISEAEDVRDEAINNLRAQINKLEELSCVNEMHAKLATSKLKKI